ncbi:hypothetical protein L0Y65_01225 [Candidatus Micrarchaeota archaeon]|nr:hypothetical protein [Candidatus Micrarchaeota archaeon]
MAKLKTIKFHFLLFALIFTTVYAENLTCQYTEQILSDDEVQNVYSNETGKFITSQIDIRDFNVDKGALTISYKVFNNYNYPLTVRVYFKYIVKNYGGDYPFDYDDVVYVPKRDYTTVTFTTSKWPDRVLTDTIRYTFIDNHATFTKYERLNLTVCKQCLGVIARDISM